MNIVFDYNRTLFDPERGELYEGIYDVLENLSKKHKLFLFSYDEFGRENLFRKMKIDQFFSKIDFVEGKNEKSMLELVENASTDTTFVIGDSLRDEICLGNKLGYETVWLKNGKFSSEVPYSGCEKPKYVISSVNEIFDILEKYKK